MVRLETVASWFFTCLGVTLLGVSILVVPASAFADGGGGDSSCTDACRLPYPDPSPEQYDCFRVCCGGECGSDSACYTSCCQAACGNDTNCLTACANPAWTKSCPEDFRINNPCMLYSVTSCGFGTCTIKKNDKYFTCDCKVIQSACACPP